MGRCVQTLVVVIGTNPASIRERSHQQRQRISGLELCGGVHTAQRRLMQSGVVAILSVSVLVYIGLSLCSV